MSVKLTNTKGLSMKLMIVLLVLSASMWFAPSSVQQAVAASDVTSASYDYKVLSGQHSVVGPQQILVVLVDFQDVKHSMTADKMRALAIDGMNGYYSDVSYGRISITGEVYGWYTVSHTMSYYGRDRRQPGEDLNLPSLAEDAAALLPSSVSISSFRFLMIIHAGQDQAADRSMSLSSEIWSQTSCSIFPDYTPPDPVMVRSKSFQCVSFLSEFDGLGTFVHETGHLFGLPDLYDASNDNSYVGYWSLMDSGAFCCSAQSDQTPSYIGAWGASVLGWITPSIPDPSMAVSSFSLTPLESPGASSILIPLSSAKYYIVEYRQKTGEDSHLPSSGVIVSYVDESLGSGEGIVRLVNPTSGGLYPSQTRPEQLDSAAFTAGSTFRDPANHVFIEFQSGGAAAMTAAYSTQELTGSLLNTNLKPSESTFTGSYRQSITLTGTLTDGNGALIVNQPVQLEIFNSTTGEWQIIGRDVTNQQGSVSFQLNLAYPVGDYQTRFVYDGGESGGVSYYATSAEFTTSIKPAKLTISVSAPGTSTTDSVPVEVSALDAGGAPLSGVNIAIYVDNLQRAIVQTDANGQANVVLALGLNEVGSHVITAGVENTNYTRSQASVSLVVIPPLWLIALLIVGIAAAIAVASLVIPKRPRLALKSDQTW